MAFLCLFVVSQSALGAQIRLRWDPNTEPELAGYRIYHGGASRVYDTSVDVKNVTTYALTGLVQGQTYYLAATAYDAFGDESDYSNEVIATATEGGPVYTLTTVPPGLQVTVDGSIHTAPKSFGWAPGSSHTLSVSSPQGEASGSRYLYASWSDGGAQEHTVTTPSSSVAYTASFATQYSLTTAANPSGGGSISPPGTTWYNRNQTASIFATPGPGYSFVGWSGDVSDAANSISLTMNGPKSVTAVFAPIGGGTETVSTPSTPLGPGSGNPNVPYSYSTGNSFSNLGHPVQYQFDWKGDGTDLSPWGTANQSKSWTSTGTYQIRARARCATCTDVVSAWSGPSTVNISQAPDSSTVPITVATNPSGLHVIVDGSTYLAPRTFSWSPGSNHTISIPSPQSAGTGTQFVFASWSDGGSQDHAITVPSSIGTYTADLTIQYGLTISVTPAAGGVVTQPGTSWFCRGESILISATPNPGFSFSGWSGNLSGKASPVSITMNGPKKVRARFKQVKYSLQMNRDPAGSGSVSKFPRKSKFTYGEQVTLTAIPKPGYVFTGWSGDLSGTENPITIVITGNMSIQSLFTKESPALAVATEGSAQDDDLPLLGCLESPSPGKSVSGIKALYGWALGGDGISKVELFIDGNYVCDIPYGGQRGDIKEAYPEYPDSEESGFATVMNYASLSPGKHLMQVKVHNSRGQTSVLGAEVFVNSFHGEMVSQASPNEWVIPGVQMTVDGVTKAYDLRLEWSNESQAFEISEIIEK